jgi:hypothetical protein
MKIFRGLVLKPETDFKVFIAVGVLSLLIALIPPYGIRALALGSLAVANFSIVWRLLQKGS